MADLDVTRESCDACLCVTSRPAFLVNDDHGQYLCVPCQRKYARRRKAPAFTVIQGGLKRRPCEKCGRLEEFPADFKEFVCHVCICEEELAAEKARGWRWWRH